MARQMKAEATLIVQDEKSDTRVVEVARKEQESCGMREEEKKDPCRSVVETNFVSPATEPTPPVAEPTPPVVEPTPMSPESILKPIPCRENCGKRYRHQSGEARHYREYHLKKTRTCRKEISKTEPEEPTQQAPTNFSEEVYPKDDTLPSSGMSNDGASPSPLHGYETPLTSAPDSGPESDLDAPSPFTEKDVSPRRRLNTIPESDDDSDGEEGSTMIWRSFNIEHIVHKLVPKGMRDNFYYAFPNWLFKISQVNDHDERFVKKMTAFLNQLKKKADEGKTWNQDCFPEGYHLWTGLKGLRTLCTWKSDETKLWSKPHRVSNDTFALRQKDKYFASGGNSLYAVR